MKDGFKGERAVVLPAQVLRDLDSDPLFRSLHLTDIGCYPNAQYHFRKREQGVPQYILICCTSGRGWVEYSGAHYDVIPGHSFIIPAGIPHAYGADAANPWTIYWAHFTGDLAEHYSTRQQPAPFVTGENPHITGPIAIFEEMLSALQPGYTSENLRYACSCLHHFLGALRFQNHRRPVTRHQHSVIERVTESLQENIDKPMNSTEIAERLGYSYSHLSALFSRNMGCSPCAYFLRLKMQQACHYLDLTDLKINEICHRVGIADPYYFSRLFRQTVGLSPRAYRRQMKG